MANSYGQFTGWVSVSDILKSEPSCTSHKPRASFQRWQVGGDLVHGKCPHAATQSYMQFKIYHRNMQNTNIIFIRCSILFPIIWYNYTFCSNRIPASIENPFFMFQCLNCIKDLKDLRIYSCTQGLITLPVTRWPGVGSGQSAPPGTGALSSRVVGRVGCLVRGVARAGAVTRLQAIAPVLTLISCRISCDHILKDVTYCSTVVPSTLQKQFSAHP